MALAIKCDICGNMHIYETAPSGRKWLYLKSEGETETTERYDLCPSCYENMKKHIEHEKEVLRKTLVRDITYKNDLWWDDEHPRVSPSTKIFKKED